MISCIPQLTLPSECDSSQIILTGLLGTLDIFKLPILNFKDKTLVILGSSSVTTFSSHCGSQFFFFLMSISVEFFFFTKYCHFEYYMERFCILLPSSEEY